MKCIRILICLLSLLTATAAIAKEPVDSLVLSRLFHYQRNYTGDISGFSSNFYCKFLYETHRRNFGLWLIPHMYSIADGQRTFFSEQYGRLHFYELGDYEHESQVYCTTIPRNRRTMPILTEFLTPSLYSVLVYKDHILSPFHQDNRRFYYYHVTSLGNGQARIYFRPRFVKNTQLMRGVATVDEVSGRIIEASFEGEYDMIRFRTIATMGREGTRSLLPKYCHTDITFKFLGNHITSTFEAVFDCPVRLPDSINVKGDRALIDSIRPVSLSAQEQAIYDAFDLAHAPAEPPAAEPADTLSEQEPADSILLAENTDSLMIAEGKETEEKPHHNYLKEVAWDFIGGHLIRSHRMQSETYFVKLSPILEPQYISYSGSKGLSYKMKFAAEYYFSHTSGLYFNPDIGYNFKLSEFRFYVPLRYVYNSRNNSYLELVWRNGNRIGNSIVFDEIQEKVGKDVVLPSDLTLFNDEELRLYNNVQLIEGLSLETGVVYHHRKALNKAALEYYGKSTAYHSFAPAIGVKTRPWRKGPVFSVDYEKSLSGNSTSLNYERWEGDISLRHYMTSLQTLNFRLGGGFYTEKESNYFTDFANFHDNNLPEGWNDDWSGQFQLLDSRLYNESQYYIRSNVSYESPLLVAAFMPIVGRFVDQERFYWSGLLIEHSRPYSELGYGFSSRYFSLGLFTSFLDLQFQRFGTKFTFELFRRW